MAADERKLGGVSTAELERRWKLVRDHMDERGLDVVIALSSDSLNNSGHTRWLTDTAPNNRHVVLFHKSDLMTVITHGPHGRGRTSDGSEPMFRGVGEIHTVAEFPSVSYTQDYEAAAAIDVLTRRASKAVGLVGRVSMPHVFVERLTEALSGSVRFSDETETFDRWMAIKSAEEKDLIGKAVAMHDAIFAKLLEVVRPGMRDVEVAAFVHFEGRLRGSTHGTINAGSAPPGRAARMMHANLQGRTMQAGDQLTVLFENTGPGGYFAEMSRPIVLGKASHELIETFEKVKEAQDYTRGLMQVGALCSDIFAAYNEKAVSLGLPAEARVHAHSQGYGIVERPLIRFDETWTLAPEMFFAVHPMVSTESLFAFVCDNCFIPARGTPRWEHRTERKIFEVS